MSTLNVNSIKDANGNNLSSLNGVTVTADNYIGMRNRIINGDCRIDQRNAGASVTVPTGTTYTLDRWIAYDRLVGSRFSVQQNAGSVTPPTGYTNYLGVTSLAATTVASGDIFYVSQRIEGLNTADLGWGTANAKTITLSFWVRSSLTGSFGGSIQNSASNRSYPFSYTISSANTWEQKSITIAGDTSGTWLTTNGIGLYFTFSLGTGSSFSGTANAWSGAENVFMPTGSVQVLATNAATFYITGVQLEVGSVATPFERRPYGTELSLCQRYYYKLQAQTSSSGFAVGQSNTTTASDTWLSFPVTMRTRPTALEQSGTATHYRVVQANVATQCSAVPTYDSSTTDYGAYTTFTVASGLTAGRGMIAIANSTSAYLAWSAEL